MSKDGSINYLFEVSEESSNDKDSLVVKKLSKSDFKHLKDVESRPPRFNLDGKVFPCKCTHVYDGDTIYVSFAYHGEIREFSIRMYGYNSAEIRTKDAKEKEKGYKAKEFMESLVSGKFLLLRIIKDDKYAGRWLGDVYLLNEKPHSSKYTVGECVNDIMVKEGHGKPYFGSGEKKY